MTLTLSGGAYESSIFEVRRGVSVSGITGVSVGTFGIQRVSDTKVTVELTFNGDIDADGTLTFTVGAGAIASYSGAALTAQLPVSAGMESVTAIDSVTVDGGDAGRKFGDADVIGRRVREFDLRRPARRVGIGYYGRECWDVRHSTCERHGGDG